MARLRRDKMVEPNRQLFEAVVGIERERYMSALKEIYDSILNGSNTVDPPVLKKMIKTYTIVELLADIFWNSVVLEELREIVSLYTIDKSTHTLNRKNLDERSSANRYSSSLRAMLKKLPTSFLQKHIFVAFDAQEFGNRITAYGDHLETVLRHFDSTVDFLEKYLTWIEYGATLASKYYNADEECKCEEEEEEETDTSEFYTSNKVRAYAILKTTDMSPEKLSQYLFDIQELFTATTELVFLGVKLYVSLSPEAFSGVLNLLTSKKQKSINSHKKHANIQEFNERIRKILHRSLENDDGLLHDAGWILDRATELYISELIGEIAELLAFIPKKNDHKRFIRQLESGRLWRVKSSE